MGCLFTCETSEAGVEQVWVGFKDWQAVLQGSCREPPEASIVLVTRGNQHPETSVPMFQMRKLRPRGQVAYPRSHGKLVARTQVL